MTRPGDIESALNELFRLSESRSVQLNDINIGKIDVSTHVDDWYIVVASEFREMVIPFTFRIHLEHPMVCMYFQQKGYTSFQDRTQTIIPEQTHSLNYFPELKSHLQVAGGTTSKHVSIKLDPAAFLSHLKALNALDAYEHFSKRTDPFVTMQNGERIHPLIQQSVHDFQHCPYKGGLAKMYRENIIQNLLIHQLATFYTGDTKRGNANSKLTKRDIDRLNELKTYVDSHYLEINSLDELARKFCLNSFKLKYGFKKLFGNSVMKYIDDLKMHYAKCQLQQNETAIIAIADELGYQHYNNFSTAFKRKFGYSPASVIPR